MIAAGAVCWKILSRCSPVAQQKNERAAMTGGYDDRDGVIWLDGAFVPWREAKVHVLSHALHYASSVFEGERAYDGAIFKSRAHTDRLLKSCDYLDIPHPYSAEEIEAAKAAVLAAS